MNKQKLPIETYLKGDSWKKILTLINRLKSLHHITYLNLIVTNSITIVRTLDTLTVFIHIFSFLLFTCFFLVPISYVLLICAIISLDLPNYI